MILLVLIVTPHQTCLINKEEVGNKIYQEVTNKTNKTQIIRLRINVKEDTLHRSFRLFLFKTFLPCFSQCNEARKFHEVNHAPT
jgi:hypothetical protein